MKINITILAIACLASFLIGFEIGPRIHDSRLTKVAVSKAVIEKQQASAHDQPIRRLPGIRPSAAPHTDIVCELSAYRIGKDVICDIGQFAGFLSSEKGDFRTSVTGFKFTVLEPDRFKGRSLTMGYDGVLASGDPMYHFYFGHRYVMRVSESRIGLDDYADLF